MTQQLNHHHHHRHSCLENSMDRGAWRATVGLPSVQPQRVGPDRVTERARTHMGFIHGTLRAASPCSTNCPAERDSSAIQAMGALS